MKPYIHKLGLKYKLTMFVYMLI